MSDKLIRAGFIAGGLINIIGILIVTQVMTSDTLAQNDPAVFSWFGIIAIMLWGAAYIAATPFATSSVALPLVFALEKFAYTANWFCWLGEHRDRVPEIVSADFLGGTFLGGYGINDGAFCLFFLVVAVMNWRRKSSG